MRYADAGVDVEVAEEAKQLIRTAAGRTFNRDVLSHIGGFGALFRAECKRGAIPILVSSADGVGTKLKWRLPPGVHSTVARTS